jgi:hypothetical protein
LIQVNPARAATLAVQAPQAGPMARLHFQQHGVCECVNEGYRQLPSYVVSAANPLAAARRLRF